MRERIAQWDRVKEDAIEIIAAIEMSGEVLDVSKLSITPLASNLTDYEEVSVEVTATIVSNYKMAETTLETLAYSEEELQVEELI